jgi:uncharacterized pyridoxamine 5'-phosphate oxidase family protein
MQTNYMLDGHTSSPEDPMDKTALIDFLNTHPGMQLATADSNGQPRTRGMFMYLADAEGIIFHTGGFKDLYRGLKGNPRVEASFYDAATFTQVRVRGQAREIDDDAWRQRIVDTPGREFLKPVVAHYGLGGIRVFRIEACAATVWTMATNQLYPKPEILW